MVDYRYGAGTASGPLGSTGVGAGTGIGSRIIRAGSFIPTGAFLILYAAALPKIVIPIMVVVAIVARTRLLILAPIAGVLWIGAIATCGMLVQVAPSAADDAAIATFAQRLEPHTSLLPAPANERLTVVLWCLLVLWICAITLLTWSIYRWDKHRAEHGWTRVPERRLLALAAFGGGLGAILGVYGHYRRHKTAKRTFMFVLMAILGVYVGLGVLFFHLEGIPIYQ